jgi:hypothetical protein
VREGALILLYRILFVLYAEDGNLLPDETGPYAAYSLTRLRTEIAEGRARGDRLSDRFTTYWSQLTGVFTAIANGDADLGIPPYNGGLFAPDAAPILSRVQLSDAVIAEVLFRPLPPRGRRRPRTEVHQLPRPLGAAARLRL